MSAAERLSQFDTLPAAELCSRAEAALSRLAATMNEETVLIRAGRYAEAQGVAAQKAILSQDYVTLARAVQRQHGRVLSEAPDAPARLRAAHERLATQMAENLRVLATARSVAETLLSDLAKAVGRSAGPQTYGSRQAAGSGAQPARGLALDRAL